MSSPSDDGQYTDTDKEEVVSKDGASETEQEPQNLHIPISPGVSVTQEKLDELSKNEENGKQQDAAAGSSGTASNDDEDEEIRLRRKLLEKRNVSEDVKTSKESLAVGTQSTNKKAEPRKHVVSVSEDEEMFSIQPKDSQIIRQRNANSKGHEEKTKLREKYQPEKNRRERSREDRHRRHRDRERERRDATQSDSSLRRFETRDDRSRHQSKVFNKEPGRTETRGVVSSRSHEEKLKTRNVRGESYESRGSHSKLPKKERSRSPKKRDPVSVGRRSSSREQPPTKKVHIEKYEMTVKQVVKSKTGEVVKTEKVEEETVTEVDMKEEVKSDASETNEKEETGMDEEEPSTSTHDEENALPSKYSKFDSSPEGEENEDDNGELSDREGSLKSDTSESESDESPVQVNSDDEKVDIMDFDEEALAKMSPETRAMIEESQQQKLISLLPAYYPGVSGCRSVAEFECLNRIEEGTFGVVYRAKEKRTDEVVALKRLKMEKEREGFPITSLREINMLLKAGNHPNIVNVREIVVGSNMDKIYLVMDYIEHDMKSLMDFMYARQKHFTIGQIKTLMRQLLSGVQHMHDEWILHRDLKTSNLLLSHKGILKIGDFGLAREFGDPLKPYTPIVVTLWYRSPELLLGIKEYSTSVDMWSCGCIFAEFLKLKPLFPGKGELDQVKKIFMELGTPNERIWPGYSSLPGPRKMRFENYEHNQLRKKFPPNILDETGFELLNKGLLAYDPKKRLSAREALDHVWLTQEPLPTPPDMFPTWPAKSELGKAVPKSPVSKANSPKQVRDEKLYRELKVEPPKKEITGFALKFDAPKF